MEMGVSNTTMIQIKNFSDLAAGYGWKGNEMVKIDNDIMVLANPEIADLPGWVDCSSCGRRFGGCFVHCSWITARYLVLSLS